MEVVRNEFDYNAYADYAQNEARKYLPQDMSEEDKNSVLQVLRESAFRTAKVLWEDKSLELDSTDKVHTFSRYILEWIFKATVAFYEVGVPIECRLGFILDVGYVSFDIAKDIKSIPDISSDQIRQTIEYHVINKIKKNLTELQLSGVITKEIKDKYLQHPYIDKSNRSIQFAIYG